MKKRKKILGIILLILAVLAFISIAAVGISISNYAKVDETQTADAAIILATKMD